MPQTRLPPRRKSGLGPLDEMRGTLCAANDTLVSATTEMDTNLDWHLGHGVESGSVARIGFEDFSAMTRIHRSTPLDRPSASQCILSGQGDSPRADEATEARV